MQVNVRAYFLVALVVCAIIYGSLFPFAFRDAGSVGDGVAHLLGTWRQPPQSRGDLLANILFYFPLGLTMSLWLRPRLSLLLLIGIAAGAGGLLSAAMEI